MQAPAEWTRAPPKQVGYAAHAGTLAHTLCEAALLLHQVPWREGDKFDVEGDEVEVTQEMLNAVSLYGATTGIISDMSLWRAIEQEVSLGWLWDGSPVPEEVFGTADFAACDGNTLFVVDFKYGMKSVKPERNSQLLCYAVGVLGKLQQERPDLADTIESVSILIVQPRGSGEPVRQWSLAVGELLYWSYAVLKPAIDTITSGVELPLVAGSHCWFCAASQGCPEYRKLKVQRSIASFPDWIEEDQEGVQ
jgi:hypothetical protein